MKTGICIDDTGTPSQKSKSRYDSGDWKTWVAMVLNDKERKGLNDILSKLCKDFNKEFGVREFHFTEIYSGKGIYRKLLINQRLAIFKVFADIYTEFKFPIIIQSFTSEDIIRNRMQILSSLKVDGFDFSNHSDLALWFLLLRVRNYLLQNNYPLYAEIFIDAGRQKPNSKQKVEILKKITENSSVVYLSSHEEPLIQFIDFIAFCINRTRWIFMNDKRSDLDIAISEISTMANFNTINVGKKKIYPDEFNVNDYDTELRRAYDKNGNLDDATVDLIKEQKKALAKAKKH